MLKLCNGSAPAAGCQGKRRREIRRTESASLLARCRPLRTVTKSSSSRRSDCVLWNTFEEHAAGEWTGRLAEFDSDGNPVELGHLYLPEAYREWGRSLYDWQIHVVTEAGRETAGKLSDGRGLDHMTRRLVPADTCECFDLEVLEESTMMLKTDEENEGEDKTVLSDGSYSAGTRRLCAAQNPTTVLETSLQASRARRNRIRIHLKHSSDKGEWVVAKVEVTDEKRFERDPDQRGWKADPLEQVLDQEMEMGTKGWFPPQDEEVWSEFRGMEFGLELDDSPQGGSFRAKSAQEKIFSLLAPVAGEGRIRLPLGCWVDVTVDAAKLIFEAGVRLGTRRKFVQRQYDKGTGYLTRLIIGAQTRLK
ncbi:hypothetical protein HOP50_08g53140 [Chloropicon primus]|uniref:DUF3598 domain-containing protein n=2 Tax=Chloropicon primus TaxID=1764295 RepID=A0A5B8MQM0_9CHLO|nr:hypothetical protein A3770_08p52840 [Chloropicon primus]UPR01990.1 hypothetical protein HOP50_08g53140 [Chloropicon primus]|eukprot:QDZ22766.1 hypothetical protein A3770_08p52840 [Chloropicon primus]